MRQRRRLIYEIHRIFFSIVWTFSIGMMYEQLIKIYCLFASEKKPIFAVFFRSVASVIIST